MLDHYYCMFFFVAKLVAATPELKLVHVLFAHATEYPVPAYTVITNLTENPILEGMTNEEMLMTYELGVRLRKRYGEFLGDLLDSEVTRVRTTDEDMSKMSAALVNAGLWPPAELQRWSESLNWQPVPMDYVPGEEDVLLKGRLCPTFVKVTNGVRKRASTLLQEAKHAELFSLIGNQTGLGIRNSEDIAYLYKSLRARVYRLQASRGLSLPTWTRGIYPNGELRDMNYLEDSILSITEVQMKLNGGFLVKKILEDSAAQAKDSLTGGRKIMMYSGDEDLLIGVMHALGVWKPHVPNPAAALIFEFLKDSVKHTYGMRVLYDAGPNNLTVPLTIPGCNESRNDSGCPFEDLILLLEKILPGDAEEHVLCGRTVNRISYEEEVDSVLITLNGATKAAAGAFVILCVSIFSSAL
ncbi:venom acid phosphatase Acph-1 isoform X1 [Neodiprion lecontei]|uniref:2-phosphoxylose phosphatase 1 n=1 Tax=Neodiprion lecontei TaxID=441921 RepID=A0ABM3GQ78_NEOLC|nr:venom acid phosphatase Acph-1 isoform X1 [Neodiprion lecontei]XP_046602429.1 venom acid phosphatase Acph-1 isoform X1 [Neodiprion lecontei]XP_046602430.1 venom acid phosphatase Acph-1 isoform X1 [Neodiprion lecontei]XP_046602431.1 venom acid phosphatase Acph-1 isoform X1 [Neodiprion lecontei]XP_046602432.1 venom acid phosphatase Acph-1 isoform X1 [Neodiprion lecontei]XP_046602433.1 venom acid phosphatase Acph-1 isoform X1 [Neodiprion lecontei]